ncbi:hypothetical protein ACFL5W_01260 [Thermodesulfobacteriota bacterium]
MAKGIVPLTLLWILIACTYQQPPLRPAPVEPPPPIEIKPETPVAAPDATALELPVPAASEPRIYLHKVRWPEETLSHIAAWYTGTIKNWKAIAKVSSELDPTKIHVGITISIPEDLLTTRKPMPHSFVRPKVPKKRTSLSSLKKTSTPLESPKLFEPIEDTGPPTIEIDSLELFGPIETEQPSVEPEAAKLFGPIN